MAIALSARAAWRLSAQDHDGLEGRISLRHGPGACLWTPAKRVVGWSASRCDQRVAEAGLDESPDAGPRPPVLFSDGNPALRRRRDRCGLAVVTALPIGRPPSRHARQRRSRRAVPGDPARHSLPRRRRFTPRRRDDKRPLPSCSCNRPRCTYSPTVSLVRFGLLSKLVIEHRARSRRKIDAACGLVCCRNAFDRKSLISSSAVK